MRYTNKFISMNSLMYRLLYFPQGIHISNAYYIFNYVMNSPRIIVLNKTNLINLTKLEIEFLDIVKKIYLQRRVDVHVDVDSLISDAKFKQLELVKHTSDIKIPPKKILFDIYDNLDLGKTTNKLLFFRIVHSKNLCEEFLKVIDIVDLTMHHVHLSHQLECQIGLSKMFEIVGARTIRELKQLNQSLRSAL